MRMKLKIKFDKDRYLGYDLFTVWISLSWFMMVSITNKVELESSLKWYQDQQNQGSDVIVQSWKEAIWIMDEDCAIISTSSPDMNILWTKLDISLQGKVVKIWVLYVYICNCVWWVTMRVWDRWSVELFSQAILLEGLDFKLLCSCDCLVAISQIVIIDLIL